MANALAIMAASRGMQAGASIGDAYKQKLFAELQSNAVRSQMQEIDARATIDIGNIFQKAERIEAEQVIAFQKGGVELEGSAMDMVADTMQNAAEAAYIRQREADYQVAGLKMQEASLKEQASEANFFLNALAGSGQAYAGFLTDEIAYNRGSTIKRGTSTRPAQGI